MKFTLSWLRDTTASLAEIVEALTHIGLKVVNVEVRRAKFLALVVARPLRALSN